MRRDLHFYCDILLEFGAPVTGHAFALRCMPPSFPGQEILDVTLDLAPQVPYARQRDGLGNLLQIGRVEAPHDHFRYTVRGTARLDRSRQQRQGQGHPGKASCRHAVPHKDQSLGSQPEHRCVHQRGQNPRLQVPAEHAEKPLPGMPVPPPEGPEGRIVQRRAGGPQGQYRHAAQQPEQTQKNAVRDLAHGNHQGIVGIQ